MTRFSIVGRLAITIAFAASLASSPSTAHISPNFSQDAWSSRGVFVFGNMIVLDFPRSIEKNERSRNTLENCSNEDYFCARGDTVQIVVPKWCKDLDDRRWHLAGVTTQVVAESSRPQGHLTLPGNVLLMADPSRPWIVYHYDEQIMAIFYDPEKNYDLISLARTGGLTALRNLSEQGHDYEFPLITFDVFGRCSHDNQPVIPGVTSTLDPRGMPLNPQ